MTNSFNNNTLKNIFILFSSFVLVACANTGSDPGPETTQAETGARSCHSGRIASGDCRLVGLSADGVPSATAGDLWGRIVEGYQLTNYAAHPRAKRYFEFYRERPRFLKTMAERSDRYLHYIVEAVAARDMPMELALLPAIESSFDPFAYSHGRAAGLWQFVPLTATHMGLSRTWWYDGRRDVVASTDAALDYLLEMHERFDGDWLLALAAYNSGATTVNRAIRKNKRAGRPTDYWSLSLPAETEAYIPKLIGLTQLLKRADYEGITLPPIANRPAFSVIETGGQIDLAQAAELAGISIDDMYLLNPGFNRWATDPNGPHHLAIPIENSESFSKNLAAIPQSSRLHWSRYTVEPGDNLIVIARRFNTDVATIKAANKLDNNLIRAGQVLMLPSASMKKSHYALSTEQRLASAQQRGKSEDKQAVYHEVATGDSLWSIARRYNVELSALARWNNMVPKDPLRTGRKLVIWQDKTQTSPRNGRSVIRWVAYTVRQGDSLAKIADRFRVKINEIAEWNELNASNYLQPGQVLSLYVDVTQLSGR